MNTIIIHPNNRVARTPEHDLSDILIAPVSPWYRKPTPWWVDKFEEVGLHPIIEADETVEEVEETEEQIESVDFAYEIGASENVEYASTDIAFEHSQGIEQGEHSIDGADILEDIVFDDIISHDDLHGMEKDRCCDNIDFFEDVILVDEGDFYASSADTELKWSEVSVDNDDEQARDEDDDDDTLTDITFTGENATFRLPVPVPFVENYERHDKATLSIAATELDSEDEGEDETIDWNRSCSETNQFFQ